MLMMKKREVPCIWPVPMLELDLEMLASTYGMGIKLPGLKLNDCNASHGMSYPVSANVRSFRAEDYDQSYPLIVSPVTRQSCTCVMSNQHAATWTVCSRHSSSCVHIHFPHVS